MKLFALIHSQEELQVEISIWASLDQIILLLVKQISPDLKGFYLEYIFCQLVGGVVW